jgi:pimeloyl-ACP methyl ester carboxylesterase
VLLMIPGGPMDADGFKDIADRLADDYTVVTYDCRGNSRSPMQGSWGDLTVGLFADDARRLLDAVGGQPAQFPGGHGGFGSHPDGFAARLREVLAGGQH